VARISVPSQLAWSEARAAMIDDGLAFSPWNGQRAYQASAKFRADNNCRPVSEPRTLEGLIPD
jgi:hypothetical protein